MTTIGLDPAHDDITRADWHCIHGNYTGSPGGADFMCGWCEDGVPWSEYVAIQRERAADRARTYLRDEMLRLSITGYGIAKTFLQVRRDLIGWALVASIQEVDALTDDEALAYMALA